MRIKRNRFLLARNYKKRGSYIEVDYEMDRLTDEPAVAAKNLFERSRVLPSSFKVEDRLSATLFASSSSGSFNIDPRYSTGSSSSHLSSSESTASSRHSASSGCRDSCCNPLRSDLTVDMENLSLIYRSPSPSGSTGNRVGELPYSSTLESKMKKKKKKISLRRRNSTNGGKQSSSSSESAAKKVPSIRKRSTVKMAGSSKHQVTPAEGAMIELKERNLDLSGGGRCWVVRGSRLTEMLLLLKNTPLMKVCKFKATDVISSQEESVNIVFECMKIYLTLCNRRSSDSIVAVSPHCPLVDEVEERSLEILKKDLCSEYSKSLLMDVSSFSAHHGYSSLLSLHKMLEAYTTSSSSRSRRSESTMV